MKYVMSADKTIIVPYEGSAQLLQLKLQLPKINFYFFDVNSAKVKIEDNKMYRLRRGKWVQIPPEWIGKIPTKATMRKRHSVSRRTRKNKNKST